MFQESFDVAREFRCLSRVSTFPKSLDVSRDEVEGNIRDLSKLRRQQQQGLGKTKI